jgi:hypothetical protein
MYNPARIYTTKKKSCQYMPNVFVKNYKLRPSHVSLMQAAAGREKAGAKAR